MSRGHEYAPTHSQIHLKYKYRVDKTKKASQWKTRRQKAPLAWNGGKGSDFQGEAPRKWEYLDDAWMMKTSAKMCCREGIIKIDINGLGGVYDCSVLTL